MSRPSLSDGAPDAMGEWPRRVAGADVPAFVERAGHPTGTPTLGGVAGADVPAFVERPCRRISMRGGVAVSPGLMSRPSLSAVREHEPPAIDGECRRG